MKRLLKRKLASQRGMTLLEVLIALALLTYVGMAVLVGLSSIAVNADHAYDRDILWELAQSQLEDIYKQSYQASGSYTTITPPAGYSIAIAVSTPVAYIYPNSTPTAQTLQQVTVTVTGVRGNMSVSGYKVRR